MHLGRALKLSAKVPGCGNRSAIFACDMHGEALPLVATKRAHNAEKRGYKCCVLCDDYSERQ